VQASRRARLTASIRIALDLLGLERVAVVYPGAKRFAVSERVEAVPLDALADPGRLFAEAALHLGTASEP